ncbi:helix-turn-helix domain-containing protein [Planococcus maritimus]|uniref:helix-turn-helix domain-containing protein n=1 Tax=Planococcus maritimus TaxID=192421 RepID=UPI000791AC89|nr:helix-turn-helix transcriptional regulator [Planococcus maritimus]KYG58282.1 transcriptional regulator [Planococcus maritimus]OED31962.1 transcriptional regulator [Planococcus maritimus]
MNIGSVIKYYRLKHNLTQSQLADGICSVSHLSKIESNTYTPHEETYEALLLKMGVQLKKELEHQKRLEQQLGRFIDCSLYYDLDRMEELYQELVEVDNYVQSTALINQYELYKFRYYLHAKQYEKANEQQKLLDKLKASFTAPELWMRQFFQAIQFSSLGDYKEAMALMDELDHGFHSIPQKLEGEFYYQKSRILLLFDRLALSAYYAELAVRAYEKDHNYIRLLHAQLLLAINYTRRNLVTQAGNLYEVIKRNAKLTQQKELYQTVLYNYAELLQSEKQDEQAIELFEELKKGLEPGSYLHKAVIVNLLEIKTMEQEATAELIAQLRMAGTSKDKEYFNIYSNYFEKQKFSQQDLLNYKEDKMFPFFKKYGYIKDTRQLSQDLAAYYKQQGKWEKAHYYQTQFLENGGE